MATKSDQIRQLAATGMAVAEIAKQVGVRYQHTYNVLKAANQLQASSRTQVTAKAKAEKPALRLDYLLSRGFETSSRWDGTDLGGIRLASPVSSEVGVYAFSIDDIVQYVGVATMGLAKRLYLYSKPGPTQTTSIRLNRLIAECIEQDIDVIVAIAKPSDLEWNGLPVHGAVGLELGLIKKFDLPWNKRSSN